MNEIIKKTVKSCSLTALTIFVVLCLFFKPNGVGEIINYIGYSSFVTLIVWSAYEMFLWKLNPFIKIPRIYGKYKGTLVSSYDNYENEKEISVDIKQTYSTISIVAKTNEITSKSVACNFYFDNGEKILYYNYVTNPQSKYRDKNPVQDGACKLIILNVNEIEGNYWTSQKTVGDLKLKRILKCRNKL